MTATRLANSGAIPPRLRRLFGRGALFDRIEVLRTDQGLPSYVAAVVCGRTAQGSKISGAGFAPTTATAVLVAVSEAIERYALATMPQDTSLARIDELQGAVLDPARLQLFTAAQLADSRLGFRAFNPAEPTHWANGRTLIDGDRLWIPADLLWLRAPSALTAGISTGAAAHTLETEALLSGLYEVVERDALAIVWEARAIVPELDPLADWQTPEVRMLAAALSRAQLQLIIRDMTTDLDIPCVLAVIHDPLERRPALAIGAAARRDRAVACARAAREAYFCWTWMRDEHARRSLTLTAARTAAERPQEMMWQAFLYGFPEAMAWSSHLVVPANSNFPAHEPPRSLGGAESELQWIQDRLAARGYCAISHELTMPEIAALDWCVHKVLVPGLVPLSIGCWCRHLANPRIETVPRYMSWPHAGPLPLGEAHPVPLP